MSGDVAVRFYGVVGMVVGRGRRPGRSYECPRNGRLKATGRIGWYRVNATRPRLLRLRTGIGYKLPPYICLPKRMVKCLPICRCVGSAGVNINQMLDSSFVRLFFTLITAKPTWLALN